MKNIFLLVLTSAFCLAGISAAFAATDTASLNVSAIVLGGARIESIGSISHTDYNPTEPTSPNDATGSITVRATKGLPYKIYIGPDRTMTNGTDNLSYEIYSDAGRTTVWGDSFATGQGFTSTTNAPNTKNIYSRIPVLQNVPPGTYSDMVLITLEW